MHMSAAVVLLGVQLASPVSDQVPKYNVEASCKGASAASVGMADAQSYNACMKEESQARDQLGPMWQAIPAGIRTRCSEEAGGGGLASYVELLVCIQIAGGDPNKMQPTTLQGARKPKN